MTAQGAFVDYTDSYLVEQLPRRNPPRGLVPDDVQREIAHWVERNKFENSELLARSARWTYAIFSELGLGHFSWPNSQFPFNLMARGATLSDLLGPRVSVGLYDPHAEAPGFGLSIDVPGLDEQAFHGLGDIRFPRLKNSFPVAIRKITTELHAPNPTNATTACWAQCNSSGLWGIITAGHAVGTNLIGTNVSLDNGNIGKLHRSFWQPIDAAFVLTSAPPIHQLSPLGMLHFPAAGLPVTVACKTGAQARTIVSAYNSLGFYTTRLFPVYLFLDRPCSPGDSGALVHLGSGDACGIYCGSQPSPSNGGTSGRAQNFAQAMFALNTVPFV